MKMKVLHINDKLTLFGGVEVYIDLVVDALHSEGVETHWVSLTRNGERVHLQSKDEQWNWTGSVNDLAQSPMGEWIDSSTVLHVHSLSEPKLLQQLFNLAPVVRHMHEPRMVCPGQGKFFVAKEEICTKPFGMHCLIDAYSKRCCNRHPKRLFAQYINTQFEASNAAHHYAQVIVNSSYLQEEAITVGFPIERLRRLPNFTPMSQEPEWKLQVEPRIAFAGRLSRTKGVHFLLEAMKGVVSHIPNAKLDILGSGHDEINFHKQAKELGLQDSVQFHGWVDRKTIDHVISQASVVAFPSIYPEAFGISGIEAMMRGKPVVGFDVGGVTDWLKDGVNGYAVKVKDTESFARKLNKLLGDPLLCERMGDAGRKMAIENFSPEVHVKQLLEIYRKCLENFK
ncbi:glycosyltransferase family 4 protein [Vibrio sp. 10N.261.51.C6]|uniref:glycosyltransferase family 4 protein n=1 Tax=Vibrio sp. 10N.261.51.C6 TaxID=3229676 RepID=UPI00354F5949